MKERSKIIFGKDLDKINIEDIEDLIRSKREEGQYLEYKSPEILRSPEKLSKTLSGFLNADGGILIIGVEEEPKKKTSINQKIYPKTIAWIKDYSCERIEQLLLSNIFLQHSSLY